MKIDERIEAHVREAFSAVIGKDGDRLVAALDGLDEHDSQIAIGLGLTVCEFVLKDAYGDNPTEAELLDEARDIVAAESEWVDLGTPEQVATFLGAVAREDTSFAGLSRKDIVGLTFVCGGHLLATRSLDDQKWWEYLNEIWAAVEASPTGERPPPDQQA
jgi:hypothetical protein